MRHIAFNYTYESYENSCGHLCNYISFSRNERFFIKRARSSRNFGFSSPQKRLEVDTGVDTFPGIFSFFIPYLLALFFLDELSKV